MDIDKFSLKVPVFSPFAGILIGIILVAVNFLLGFILPLSVIAIFLVCLLAITNGFKNINGFSNTINKIFKMEFLTGNTSNIIIVLIIVLLKIKLIESVPADEMNKSLIFVPLFGRWIGSVSLFLCPCADTKPTNNAAHVIISSVVTLLITILTWWIRGISLFMMVLGFGILFSLLVRIKFTENTEETYRASIEITEIITLIFIYILFQRGYYNI